MIIGAHSIIYSTNPDADRAFLRDVLKLTNVDVGDGWLIFGLPPSEVAVHPSKKNDVHELYLMCDDVEGFTAAMKTHGIACGAVQNQGWGLLTQLALPGGGKLGVYQPARAAECHEREEGREEEAGPAVAGEGAESGAPEEGLSHIRPPAAAGDAEEDDEWS
jgi:hypothetical protein